jgi:hypothetical protein
MARTSDATADDPPAPSAVVTHRRPWTCHRCGGRECGLVVRQVRAIRSDPLLRREADMMAFYLGITLLVALSVSEDAAPPPCPNSF